MVSALLDMPVVLCSKGGASVVAWLISRIDWLVLGPGSADVPIILLEGCRGGDRIEVVELPFASTDSSINFETESLNTP